MKKIVKKRPGGVELLVEKGRQVRVWRVLSPDGTYWVRVSGPEGSETHRVMGADEGSASGATAKKDDLIAQFPGRVRKVLVREGEAVQEDQPLLLIEAMKMEFPIRSPYEGVVKKVFFGEGSVLSPGQLLVDVERKA